MSVRSLLRRLRREQGGFTLTEVITTLAILATVIVGITQLFVAGMSAEVDMRERFDAQMEARLAVNKLRRDVHCASALTQGGSTAVRPPAPNPNARTYYSRATLTVPTDCRGGGGTITWCTASLGTSRYGLFRNTGTSCGSSAQKVADYLTQFAIFSYTGPTTAEKGKVHVELPVDAKPGDADGAYTLEDALVLRNTARL
ncbi:MAG: type II secretion system protein [Thermoleophilia bacterium]|nr:type II secretion system protein [Thermoleophilia bacterium]